MRDTHRMREKYDLSLDSRQVVSLLIGGIVVLGAVFVLGVLVGKKLAGTRPLRFECSWISPFGMGLIVTSPTTPEAARLSNCAVILSFCAVATEATRQAARRTGTAIAGRMMLSS